jgi:hypothetical protein
VKRSVFGSVGLVLAISTLVACSTKGERRVGVTVDAGRPDSGFDGAVPDDAGGWDPFDPDSACGLSIVPTERVPGSLLLLFDRSGSMDEPPDPDDMTGGPSKWTLATDAINSVLSSSSDDLGAGLLLFPTGEGPECDVALSATVPHVPVAPLATTRSQISSTLTAASPSGGVTPVYDALRAGYDYLDTLDTVGQRGVIVVTDGAENCDEADRDAVLARIESEHVTNNYLTYVVGLTTANNVMSTMAINGGTRRNDTCVAECTTSLCNSDADCPGGAPCWRPFPIGPGQCQCRTMADCPAPLSCTTLPLIGSICIGVPNCCHYNAAEGSFAADFQAALEDIARRFLESCVFEVPIGDPAEYDPTLVNVGVTFEGEPRTVLGQSVDDTVDSWNFTTPESTSIIIQGPICDALLMSPATVEIVLGCPTILI